jgi:hypothetical protein
MRRMRPLCCARTASGQAAAAPPRSVRNSRRLMSCSPWARTTPYHIVTRRAVCCASQQKWAAHIGSGSTASIWACQRNVAPKSGGEADMTDRQQPANPQSCHVHPFCEGVPWG